MLFQTFVLATVLWWACQGFVSFAPRSYGFPRSFGIASDLVVLVVCCSVDIFLQLLMSRRWLIANKKRLITIYHCVAWPFPALTGILGITNRTYGQIGALAL
jgi:hypothetical protein